MSSLLTRTDKLPKEEYNKIPVHYCNDFLSLAVVTVAGMEDACYCDKCGSTNIEETSIEEWEALYKKKHGFLYLNNNY